MKKLKILLQSNSFYFCFFSFVFFYVLFFTQIITYKTHIPDETQKITAKILSYSIDGDKVRLLVKNKEKIRATYYLKSEEEKIDLEKNLKIGLTITLYGEKQEIKNPTIPNTFDYKKYLYHERIYYCFSASKIKIQNIPISFANQIKNKIDERLKKLGNNAYLRAFILGDKTFIDSKEYDQIMNNGVGHLFALSGMHLSFIYLFLNKILKKLKYKTIIIFLFLFFYLFVTGFSISFIRAILFLGFTKINKRGQFNLSPIKILFLTAFFLLLYNPFYIYNIGFWYTFTITFSLIYTSDLLKKQNKFKKIILISLITFLFSMPITIYISYEVNLFSILANILLVPFISAIVFPLAFLSFFIPIFLPLFQISIGILGYLNTFFQTFACPIIIGKIQLWEVLLLYVFLVLGFKFHLKRLFVFFILFFIFLYNKNLLERSYSVYFLDVGQGDATLFVAPKNKEVILIDTGGNTSYPKKDYQVQNKEFKLSDNIILFLKSLRIRKIDLLLITHGDMDHIGYASAIGKEIFFKNVMINHGSLTEKEAELIETYRQVTKYSSKCFDFKTYFLREYDNENENSILTRINIYNQTFLLMGDASKNVEKDFLKNYHFKVDFLKVGHHGSDTSSSTEFINTMLPKYSIISVGQKNRYGHPKASVLNTLANSTILRTDQKGTIEIKLSQNYYKIITHNP